MSSLSRLNYPSRIQLQVKGHVIEDGRYQSTVGHLLQTLHHVTSSTSNIHGLGNHEE